MCGPQPTLQPVRDPPLCALTVSDRIRLGQENEIESRLFR